MPGASARLEGRLAAASAAVAAPFRPVSAGLHLGGRPGVGVFSSQFSARGAAHPRALCACLARGVPAAKQPSAITSEASWHRRARRLRQQSRAILAVERARRTLGRHHGGGIGQNAAPDMAPKGKSLPSWDCAICGISDNWGTKARCRVCDAYPPEAHRRLVKASCKGGKGGGGGSSAKGEHKGKGPANAINANVNNNGSKYGNYGTYAFRQMQKARDDEKFNQARSAFSSSLQRYQDAQRRADNLAEQNKKLLRELSEVKTSRTQIKEEWDEAEEGPEEMSEEDRKSRIEKVRASLPYLEEQFGIESEVHQGAIEELEMHQRALREAKPYKTHRTILERRVEKLRRLQDRDRAKLAELQEAAEEIRSKVSSTAAAVTDREREIDATESELKELVLRAVGEESNGAHQAPIDPHRGWAAVVGTVAQLVQQPGVPHHVATQIEGAFGQLQSMVAALQAHAASIQDPAQATPNIPMVPIGKPDSSTTTAHTPTAPANAAPASSSTTPAAQPPNTNGAEDQRRGQHADRATWRQRKSQEAIMEYERACRLVQAVEGPRSVLDQGDQQQQQAEPPTPPPQQTPQETPSNEEGRRETATGTAAQQASASGGSNHNTPTAEAPIAAAAAAASAAAAAASDAAATAIANAPPAAGGDTRNNTTRLSDVDAASDQESDITGTVSDGERDRMEVDAVVDKIPAEQRAGVKALLEKRRTIRVRQLQRHKKPEGDELGRGAVRDAKRR